jgi:glutamine amidotransferase
MCIAIVKKAGVSIPEDHLYNGWLANDDGAGFCCIDENGEFIIHKSMTWLGFIDKYRDAVENYGDTSDFLIHFRITSKGATNLDNCHPFQVDRDRVIMHNGTITNLEIPKGDSRSDTRVFAEDWLPSLPENWEDNEIIQLLIESFIGWSKVCLLHRTKGIYIFNEKSGHWFEGNWYSNSSYEPKKVYNFPARRADEEWDYYSTGFWSNKDKKYITAAEARLMSDDEKYEHKTGYLMDNNTAYDKMVKCETCGVWCDDKDVLQMMVKNKLENICLECYQEYADQMETCDSCYKDFAPEDIDEVWLYKESTSAMLCEKCQEELAYNGIEFDIIESFFKEDGKVVHL